MDMQGWLQKSHIFGKSDEKTYNSRKTQDKK